MDTKVDSAIEVVTSDTLAVVTSHDHTVEVATSDIEESIKEITKSNKPLASPTTSDHIGNSSSVKFTGHYITGCL